MRSFCLRRWKQCATSDAQVVLRLPARRTNVRLAERPKLRRASSLQILELLRRSQRQRHSFVENALCWVAQPKITSSTPAVSARLLLAGANFQSGTSTTFIRVWLNPCVAHSVSFQQRLATNAVGKHVICLQDAFTHDA